MATPNTPTVVNFTVFPLNGIPAPPPPPAPKIVSQYGSYF